jgi:hypothetical protein
MTARVSVLVMFGLFASGCTSESTSSTIRWQGHVLQEVRSLGQVPVVLQAALGAGQPGLGGVADRGQPFNHTDVVDQQLPMRRFLVAGHDGRTWLVAVEHGGRGYSVEVLLFATEAPPATKRWVLLDRPDTLAEVVRQIAKGEAA